MELFGQILRGTILLSACGAIHIAVLTATAPAVSKISAWGKAHTPRLWVAILIAVCFAMVGFAHTVQVWLWAAVLVYLGALADLKTAIYFSLVTYTTLGYGDVVLGSDYAVFGAFAAVTGLLTFGLSTAFLVGVFSRILKEMEH